MDTVSRIFHGHHDTTTIHGWVARDENGEVLFWMRKPEKEKRLWEIMKSEGSPIGPLKKFTDDDKRVFHAYSGQLLALARKQFIKDGYIIEKKAFRDAVEKIDDKHKAEMSIEYSLHCKVENRTRHAVMNWEAFQKVAQKFIDIGKAEALKDLPRWKKERPTGIIEERIAPAGLMDAIAFYYNGQTYYIKMEDLAAFFKK